MSLDLANRIRNVTAVLGPTNTGKTHLAIERMLGHDTGLIGLPLRLLAREVYDKVAARVGADKVALITGEEKIKPESPRYYVCTVEAMPREADVDFLAIDEVQLAADPERGHVFTDRLLHVRGRQETLLLGAQTMREAISDLIPGANFISRPRLSKLTYAGEKKITRLPPRSALVAFSASEVYAIAELIRRQRGGAAVVLGALSPRTRNAQVALYQSGDVDFLVATDAIGMGLNLDVDHVAFAGTRKFDGQVHRALTPAELAQIGGRAGRHMNDGTFGVTGGVEPFSADVIERLETHTFDTVKSLQWRSRDLDFGSLDRLRDSLRQTPREAPAGAGAHGRRHHGAGGGQPRSGGRRAGDRAGRRRPPVGGVPGPRLPQDLGAEPRRAGGHALQVPPDRRGAHPGRLVRQPGRLRRPHRRRHRYAGQPHRPHPHLDVRVQPRRLAGRPRALAGAHQGHRGQPVGRPARAPDAALRRPPHQRADARPEGKGRAVRRDRRRRRRQGGAALRRPPEGLPLLRRHGGRGHPRQGRAQCRRARADQRAVDARAPRRGRQGRRLQADASRHWCSGARRRSRGWRPATIRSSPSSSCSPTST